MCAQGTEYPPPPELKKELIATVREVIGPIATPDVIHWAPGESHISFLPASWHMADSACLLGMSSLRCFGQNLCGHEKSHDKLCVLCRAAKDQVREDHAPHPEEDRQQVRTSSPNLHLRSCPCVSSIPYALAFFPCSVKATQPVNL